MIEIAPFLNDFYADFLKRTERFLSMQGARGEDYAITWQSPSEDRMMIVQYDDARFDDGDHRARITIPGPNGTIMIETGLRMALGIVRATFDRVDNLAILHEVSSADKPRLEHWIDRTQVSQDGQTPGLVINEAAGAHRLENIEERGARSTLAISPSIPALEYVVFAIQYQARIRVGRRFAALSHD